MNQKLLGLVVAIFLLVIFGVSVSASLLQAQVGEPLENPDPGQKVYELYCIGCHGELGNGKGTAAYAMEIAPRDFINGPYLYGLVGAVPSDQALHDTIAYGRNNGAMPAFPLLTANERDVVVAYIKKFYAAGWPAGTGVVAAAVSDTEIQAFIAEVNNLPDSAKLSIGNARIQNIMDNANPACSTCHTLNAFGYAGGTGPALTGIGSRQSYAYIVESIVNPSAVIAPACPTGPCSDSMYAGYSQNLSPAEVDALARWLMSDQNN